MAINGSQNGRRRVVITGMGAVSPLGNDAEESWRALLAGESGAGEITQFDHADYRVHFACEQARPRGLDIEPERCHRAQPGDDDASASVERTVPRSHYIPSPPSTRSTSPVMNAASSEQRKRTAPATSFGSPSRPSGVLPSIAEVASSGRTSVSCVRT